MDKAHTHTHIIAPERIKNYKNEGTKNQYEKRIQKNNLEKTCAENKAENFCVRSRTLTQTRGWWWKKTGQFAKWRKASSFKQKYPFLEYGGTHTQTNT